MYAKNVLKILSEVGAVITDSHIVYTSGKHGSAYVNKDALYPNTFKTQELCLAIAEEFLKDNVQVVIAPAVGGVILSQWTAHLLTIIGDIGKKTLSVYADKTVKDGEDAFVIKRGYDKLIRGKNVLVVEDLLTTGGSVRKVVEAVRECRGNVIGVGVLCNRGNVTTKDLGDVPRLVALVDIKLDAWDERDCPLCAQNVPINIDVGHGRAFLAQKQK